MSTSIRTQLPLRKLRSATVSDYYKHICQLLRHLFVAFSGKTRGHHRTFILSRSQITWFSFHGDHKSRLTSFSETTVPWVSISRDHRSHDSLSMEIPNHDVLLLWRPQSHESLPIEMTNLRIRILSRSQLSWFVFHAGHKSHLSSSVETTVVWVSTYWDPRSHDYLSVLITNHKILYPWRSQIPSFF